MPANSTLTSAERAMMGFLARYIRQHQYAPTIREIREGLGISSPSVVFCRLQRLQLRGLVAREPGRSRALRIVGDPAAWEVTR